MADFNGLSIRWRLRLIKLIVVSAMLGNIVVVHQALTTESVYDAEYHAVQAASMSIRTETDYVDVLRGDFYSSLLASTRNAEADADRWNRDLDSLRGVVSEIDNAALPGPVRAAIDPNMGQVHELIGELAHVGRRLADPQDGFSDIVETFEDKIAIIRKQSQASARILDNATDNLEARVTKAGRRATLFVVASGLLAALITILSTGVIARSIQRTIGDVAEVADDIAGGKLESRCLNTGNTEIGRLGKCINVMAGNLENTLAKMTADAEERNFINQLLRAFESTDSESEIFSVVNRAMLQTSASEPMEMLLADSSKTHLELAAVHPEAGGPGCLVSSPNECMAVRRGGILSFENSEALDACPKLRGRACGPVSATCVPITFMGNSMGVLHTASPVDQPLAERSLSKFRAIALYAGNRIGMVRAFARSQLQAATDGMTGLANRRSMEVRLRALIASDQQFSIILADLDNFKKLNDTFGHQAGDKALKLFSGVLTGNLRGNDLAARWGGEEFVIVLSDAAEHAALAWTDRVRALLAKECQAKSDPVFTASFGIAHSSLADDISDLIKIADEALYQSKEDGRDRSTVGTLKVLTSPTQHDTERSEIIQYPLSTNG